MPTMSQTYQRCCQRMTEFLLRSLTSATPGFQRGLRIIQPMWENQKPLWALYGSRSVSV